MRFGGFLQSEVLTDGAVRVAGGLSGGAWAQVVAHVPGVEELTVVEEAKAWSMVLFLLETRADNIGDCPSPDPLFAGSGHLFREEVEMSGVVPMVAATCRPNTAKAMKLKNAAQATA